MKQGKWGNLSSDAGTAVIRASLDSRSRNNTHQTRNPAKSHNIRRHTGLIICIMRNTVTRAGTPQIHISDYNKSIMSMSLSAEWMPLLLLISSGKYLRPWSMHIDGRMS